jgi:ATP-dependent 26S proteasome regulatory subunit
MTDTTSATAAARPKSRSEEVAADVSALLRARNPLLWIVTREEARAEKYLFEAAKAAGYIPRTWDCGKGIADIAGKTDDFGDDTIDIGETLKVIRKRADAKSDRGVWIMRDLPPWLAGPAGMVSCRQVANLARELPGMERDAAQALIVLSSSKDVPPELAGHATVIEWPIPDRAEVASALDALIEGLPEEMKKTAAPNGVREAAIDAAIGLTNIEAQSCFSKSIVQLRRIDPVMVANEKKRVISREKVLEWFDPLPGGLDSVGGLDELKRWLRQLESAWSPAARAYGLPAPKGTFIAGITGCGKSLTAKATATAFKCPLLKLDLGALKGKFVGDSEANLRKAFSVIEAIGKCVVWIDEIEKALAGATQGGADGGVSSDQLGGLLQWMQESKSGAFIIATANDITGLPPELMRKGRFDELWFVDLPNRIERVEVLRAALKSFGRSIDNLDPSGVASVVGATDGFTGSEIAAIVPDAMRVAFNEDAREITAEDLLASAATVTPISKTAATTIQKMREWAQGKARPATTPEAAVAKAKAASGARILDVA